MSTLDSYDFELVRYLYETYVLKKTAKPYGDVSKEMEKLTGVYKDPHMALPHNLGRVSKFCHDELNLPLISLGVFRGDGDVGVGFARMARTLKPEYTSISDKEIQQKEKQLINIARENGDWQRLVDYLSGIPVDVIMANNFNSSSVIDNTQSIEEPGETHEIENTEAMFFDEPIYADENQKISEGARKQVVIDIRERNSAARNICLKHWGTACVVCGIDFGVVYGSDFHGKIHVHHLNPLCTYDDEHDINPIDDLRPVCPNCHMIMHCRKDSPYDVDETKALIRNAKLKTKG